MASKVLVPAAPFAKLQVKKSPPETGGGFVISGGDAAARVAHLEHSVRFLQEQHRLMLSGLHAEIEALRERNRDLQFQLIFNKESSPKIVSPSSEDNAENNEEASLRREVGRLEREAAAARGEARAAEARALQLQRLVDAHAQKLRELEVRKCSVCAEGAGVGASAGACAGAGGGAGGCGGCGGGGACADESRAELRARLADAERLVRRLRGDAERQRREVLAAAAGGAVTNLLFDGAAARHAHVQCMKNSLHASLRASGLDAAATATATAAYGYQNNYHFPPVHTPDFWREPLREEYGALGPRGRSSRRPLALPELCAAHAAHAAPRSTVYANNHTRTRANGYENKNKKLQGLNGETVTVKSPDEPAERPRLVMGTNDIARRCNKMILDPIATYPELKVVITKIIPHDKALGAAGGDPRVRTRRHHRKRAPPAATTTPTTPTTATTTTTTSTTPAAAAAAAPAPTPPDHT